MRSPAEHTRFPRLLRVCAMQAVRRAQRLGPSRFVSAARPLGGTGVPQEWGQPRTGGTGFLGTPDNYTQLLQKRPISPDLFGVEGAGREDYSVVARPRRLADFAFADCRRRAL